MYSNSAQSNQTPDVIHPALKSIMERFTIANTTRRSIIVDIESRLHNILDRRVVQANDNGPTGAKERSIEVDFTTSASRVADILDDDNNRLQSILNHLHEII